MTNILENIDTSLPALGMLVEQRVELLRHLAASLETSTVALARNDAEAIARGAAHQAELCRQWSCLEGELRREASRGLGARNGTSANSAALAPSAELQAEWERLATRIRYLTRVHWSLLRHLERTLAVLNRVAAGCMPTYLPGLLPVEAAKEVGLRAGG